MKGQNTKSMTITIPASHVVAKETLACQLYTKYCEKVGGKAYNGDPLPSWEEFVNDPKKKLQSDAWRSTAEVAIAEISATFTVVICETSRQLNSKGQNFNTKDPLQDS